MPDPFRADTPQSFKAGRLSLGLSCAKLAALFRVSDGRTVRRWEAGDRDIPGPAQVLMEALITRRLPRKP